MLASLSSVYTNPYFLLHLAIYWASCLACFVYDVRIFVGLQEDTKKFPAGLVRRKSRIDWLLYFYAIWYSLFAQFVLLAPMLWLSTRLYEWRGMTAEASDIECLERFVLCGVVQEVLFYYGHRALHHPLLWKYHQTHHELVTPVAVATLYASLAENLLVNVLPVVASPVVAGLPARALGLWTVVATVTPIVSHCGFVDLAFVSRYHALHHALKTKNFGVLGVLDVLHGTYLADVQGPTAAEAR